MQTIHIKGMHCASCGKLIKMEIEEGGLGHLVHSLSEDGELILAEQATPEGIEKIKYIINEMDGYSVLE